MDSSNNLISSSGVDELEQLLLDAEDDINLRVQKHGVLKTNNVNITEKAASKLTAKCNLDNSITVFKSEADSSDDDEAVANFLEQKYNEYGRDIILALKKKAEDDFDRKITNDVNKCIRVHDRSVVSQQHKFPSVSSMSLGSNGHPKDTIHIGIYTDPVFGLRIVHPLISSSTLQDRMKNRKAVSISTIRHHIDHGNLTEDWAIAGVIVGKGTLLTSKKGAQYTVWKLSDLNGEIKMISLFLFKGACKDLWKTAQGMVVAVLNPSVMEKNADRHDEACLSADNSQKFMLLGQSKDFSRCKSRKKNGETCNAVVNKNVCEFCVYHVKQEYGKLSGRTELQSATSGRGLENLRNKVLGKNEIFYGGQSFTAVPAKKNPKLVAKDQKRLKTLSSESSGKQTSSKFLLF